MCLGVYPCQPGQGKGPTACRERVREEEDGSHRGWQHEAQDGSVTPPAPAAGSERLWAHRESWAGLGCFPPMPERGQESLCRGEGNGLD